MAKKKSKTGAKSSRIAALVKAVPQFTRQIAGFCLKIGPMLLLLGASAAGTALLWSQADSKDAFVLRGAVSEAPLPPEAPDELRQELARLQESAAGLSLLDPDAPGKLRAKYAASPWVEKTIRFVRDLSRKRIVADYTVRLPAAQVRRGRYYLTVDEEGVLLPTVRSTRPRDNLPVIYCKLPDAPADGKRWESTELAHALGVLKTIRRSIVSDRLVIGELLVRRSSYVDTQLQRRSTRPSIDIRTASGALVRWGAFNAGEDEDELLNAEKIEMLRRVLGTEGSLSRGDRVDIRTKSVYFSSGSAMRTERDTVTP